MLAPADFRDLTLELYRIAERRLFPEGGRIQLACRDGFSANDKVHVFKGGSIQMLTDVAIDPAGNVWAANNWNNPVAAISGNPDRAISTWGGGSGLTVIYGVAAPVEPPRIGVVKGY